MRVLVEQRAGAGAAVGGSSSSQRSVRALSAPEITPSHVRVACGGRFVVAHRHRQRHRAAHSRVGSLVEEERRNEKTRYERVEAKRNAQVNRCRRAGSSQLTTERARHKRSEREAKREGKGGAGKAIG